MPLRDLRLIRPGAMRDAAGINTRSGAILLRGDHVLEIGDEDAIARTIEQVIHWGMVDAGSIEEIQTVSLPRALVMPAMVNAHAHLDLTAMGPRPLRGGFIDWVGQVIRDRPTAELAIAEAVRRGLAMSRAAGVGFIGDIAGSDAAVQAHVDAASTGNGVPGVVWRECLGFGENARQSTQNAWQHLQAQQQMLDDGQRGALRLGLQPHAPYSTGSGVYREAAEASALSGVPACTHLAETRDEDRFVRDAAGPFVDLLKRMGKWDGSLAASNASPVAWFAGVCSASHDHASEQAPGQALEQASEQGAARWVTAHVNYASDQDIAQLAAIAREARDARIAGGAAGGFPPVSIAYCPIASEYFGHRDHRYRRMLAAGINVCLGTDSILCQPADEPQPLGILPAMRRLYRRDDVSADVLLEMATVRGHLALATPPAVADGTLLRPGSLIAVDFDPDDPTDPLEQVLRHDEPARPLDLSA